MCEVPFGNTVVTQESSAQHSQTEDPWVPKHKSFQKWKKVNLGVNQHDTQKYFHCPLVRSERPNTRTSGVRNCALYAWHHLKYSSGGFNAIGGEATVRRTVELTNLNNVIEKECALISLFPLEHSACLPGLSTVSWWKAFLYSSEHNTWNFKDSQ